MEITRDARLVLRVPLKAPMRLIEEFISRKRSWIERTRKIVKERFEKFSPKRFSDGEEFLYLGKSYKLNIVDEEDILILNGNFRLPRKYLGRTKEIFTDWYKEEALKIIPERVRWFAQAAGADYQYRDVKISRAEKRWGSCSPQGRLRFSWRLIMAPPEVIDYVVVHELVHVKEKNHARAFWGRVESILPSYKKQTAWLRENEHLLAV